MATANNASEPSKSRRPPATTREGRENQLISLAVDLAEEQIRAGNVSAQVLTHYLKLGTTREQLEQERLKKENLLLAAKQQSLVSADNIEGLFKDAIKAMTQYQGRDEAPEDDYED